MKVWVGILAKDMLAQVEFMDDLDVDYGFKAPGLAAVSLPYAEGLVNLVQEKFEFLTAESGPQGELGDATRDRDLSGRLSKVEAGLGEIREFLMELREKKTRSDKSHTSQDARKSPTPPATPRASALRKNPSRRVSFAGLDPSVVDAALQAGVPEAHLQEMSGLLASRPSKMEDLPRPGTGKPRDPLSDSEDDGDELVPDADAGSTGASSSDTGVARAIVKLTKVCSHLANQKSKKKGDQLKHLLDLGQGSEGSIEGSGLGSSKKAAALRVLKRQLTENPKALFESIESNLHSDFAARPIRPGVPTAGGTVRGWLESRSRVQNYTGHVRWCWQVAGIWDCLIAGEVDQARARCALLLSAADQSSIDAGSWVLAQQVLLEAPPPYHSFSSHQNPSIHERQHSALLDPRWLDLLLHYVRELDSYQEAKRRLGGKGVKKDEEKDSDKPPKPKAKAKAGGKGKGKPSSSGGEEKEAAA